MVRYVRGAMGSKHRQLMTDKTLVQDRSHKSGAAWGWIPKPKHEFDAEWNSVDLGTGLFAVLPDIHIPFHNRESIQKALEDAKLVHPTKILINGDLSDFYSCSRFDRNPKLRDFKDEVIQTRQFLVGLRETFPEAEIIWKLGNHEERWEAYLWAKCPEICGINLFTYEKVFETEVLEIRVVGNKQPLKLGKLNVIHGHEYSFPIANPVNPSRGLFLRAKAQCLCSHLHQTSHHSEKTIDDLVLSTWSTGCLCGLHPRYRPLNNWNHGFAYIKVDKNGSFEVSNLKVLGGRIFQS